MKKLTLALILLFSLLSFSLQAQSTSAKDYLGEYACISHGTASLALSQQADQIVMHLCKDLINNRCEDIQIHPKLATGGILLAKKGEEAAEIDGMKITVSQNGKQPIVQVVFADGLEMEFLRRE